MVHVVAVMVPRGDGRRGYMIQGVYVWDAWERRTHGAGSVGWERRIHERRIHECGMHGRGGHMVLGVWDGRFLRPAGFGDFGALWIEDKGGREHEN